MKKTIILILLSLSIQYSFGQACGKYRLKYIGEINVDSAEIISIELPTTMYLQGIEEKNSDYAFIEVEPKNKKIDFEVYSHLTSVFTKKENLLRVYEKETDVIPIIIRIKRNGKIIEIIKEIVWKDVEMKVVEDDKFGTLFELNLREIEI